MSDKQESETMDNSLTAWRDQMLTEIPEHVGLAFYTRENSKSDEILTTRKIRAVRNEGNKAVAEYEKFRPIQDAQYISDFDREIAELEAVEKRLEKK